MRVTVLYFASLRDAAGCARETVDVDAMSLSGLYEMLTARHGFLLSVARVRVARNEAFVAWDAGFEDGDTIAFIPPVSGG